MLACVDKAKVKQNMESLYNDKRHSRNTTDELEYLDQLMTFQDEVYQQHRKQVVNRKLHLQQSAKFDINRLHNRMPEDIEWYIIQFLGKECMDIVRKSSIIHRYADNSLKYCCIPRMVKRNLIIKHRILPSWFSKTDIRRMTVANMNGTIYGELENDNHLVANMDLVAAKSYALNCKYEFLRELEVFWQIYTDPLKKNNKFWLR